MFPVNTLLLALGRHRGCIRDDNLLLLAKYVHRGDTRSILSDKFGWADTGAQYSHSLPMSEHLSLSLSLSTHTHTHTDTMQY